MRRLWPVGAVVALVVAGFLTWRFAGGDGNPFREDRCTVTVQGRTVELTPEQAENASLIAATSVRRGLPARAATIALATAIQESKLVNIDYGDRDSVGLFQQRPSQGWGTLDQVQDAVYATNAFYDALEKVADYESMEITMAAQAVQRSGFPEAYADHEPEARVLASALTGQSRRSFHCRVSEDPGPAPTRLEDTGLTERASVVRRDVEGAFGEQNLGGFAPGGVRDGHREGSAHYDGRAIDIFFRPVSRSSKAQGWATAQYLVANAARLDVRTVIFDGRIWTSGPRSDDGWREYSPDTTGRDRATAAVLEHRDHVHVDVHP